MLRPLFSSHSLVIGLALLIGALAMQSSVFAQSKQPPARPPAKAEKKSKKDEKQEAPPAIQLIGPKQIEMLIGLKLTSANINMLATIGTTAFPTNWPEQKVEIVEAKVPAPFQYKFRDLPGGNKQLLFESIAFPAQSTIEMTLRVRIEKSHIGAPEDTSIFVAPKPGKKDELKIYLGSSPYIDPGLSEIKKILKEIDQKEPENAWQRVEMMYDWVRENIVYQQGEMKTVKQALKDKKGDCEEMTGVFIALCRAAKVPARCVWIPNHCYPEFYLEDADGNGTWFPCQAAGTRNFGAMPEYLPILQKGDRFKVPEDQELLRYLKDTVRSQERYTADMPKPKVSFIRQLLGDAANLPVPDRAAPAAATK
jgi:Transglutaminase-like superfamily